MNMISGLVGLAVSVSTQNVKIKTWTKKNIFIGFWLSPNYSFDYAPLSSDLTGRAFYFQILGLMWNKTTPAKPTGLAKSSWVDDNLCLD